MQYWLVEYDAPCPSSWQFMDNGAGGNDCIKTGAGIDVPAQAISQLPHLLFGAQAARGVDTLTMTTSAQAYAVTNKDNIVFLSHYWKQAEYNVFGDCCDSQANFNPGTSLTVKILLVNGTATKPVCEGDDGTTGETNNLNLGPCKAVKGDGGTAYPYVQFVESLPKQ
jgi:hypothetical protein